ncbi:semaphorin-6D-like [Sparus aurata]|uniref:semaphorin-6D-like n=1 Tax=Sparus aurata TaxID=8175 RepID=UPI0011C0F1E5|nr:semaphorin-6D-like [Sparus aurata]
MDLQAGANVHYTLLIACVLVAFFLGAILSGFLVSCYCSRSAAQRARRLGKDPEASLPHALSLRSLAKLNGLLDGQPKEDKLDVSTPKMYSSFIPNGHSEPHLHTPVHQGLPLGDPELSLSQSLSQADGELSGLPTPDSTPELPIKNMKALRHHQYEKNQNCNNAKDNNPPPGPSCSGSSLGFMAVVGNSLTQQVFPFSHHHSNSFSNGAAHGAGASSTSLHLPEERKMSNDERVMAAAGGGGGGGGGGGAVPLHHHSQQSLPQTVVDVSALDELLKHIHEVSASGTGGIKVLTSTSSSSLFPSSSTGGHNHHHHHHHNPPGQTRTHHYNHSHHHSNHHNNNSSSGGGGGGGGGHHHQQKIPETESTSYYSTSTLPRDGLPKRLDAPVQNSTSSSATSSSSSSSSSNNPTSSTSIPSSSSSSSSTPLQQQVIPERPGGSSVSVTRHHSQRHSLIKMGSGSGGGGGGGGGAVPRHHSFNQRGAHAHFLARMNTNSSSNGPPPASGAATMNTSSESQRPSVASSCLTRQHSYSEGPHVQRAAIVRRTASLKPQVPPKPLFLPNTATSPVAEAGKYKY